MRASPQVSTLIFKGTGAGFDTAAPLNQNMLPLSFFSINERARCSFCLGKNGQDLGVVLTGGNQATHHTRGPTRLNTRRERQLPSTRITELAPEAGLREYLVAWLILPIERLERSSRGGSLKRKRVHFIKAAPKTPPDCKPDKPCIPLFQASSQPISIPLRVGNHVIA